MLQSLFLSRPELRARGRKVLGMKVGLLKGMHVIGSEVRAAASERTLLLAPHAAAAVVDRRFCSLCYPFCSGGDLPGCHCGGRAPQGKSEGHAHVHKRGGTASGNRKPGLCVSGRGGGVVVMGPVWRDLRMRKVGLARAAWLAQDGCCGLGWAQQGMDVEGRAAFPARRPRLAPPPPTTNPPTNHTHHTHPPVTIIMHAQHCRSPTQDSRPTRIAQTTASCLSQISARTYEFSAVYALPLHLLQLCGCAP